MSGAEAAAAAADDPWPSMARQWPVVEPRLRWSWCRPGATYKEAVTLATLPPPPAAGRAHCHLGHRVNWTVFHYLNIIVLSLPPLPVS